MSSFTDEIEIEMIGKDLAVLKKSITFYLDEIDGFSVTLPIGTKINGASEPDWLSSPQVKKKLGWLIRFLKWDRWDRRMLPATAVHDFLVGEFGPKGLIDPTKITLTWDEAAKWFDKALQVTDQKYGNVSWMQRKVMVYAVKLYGKFNNK